MISGSNSDDIITVNSVTPGTTILGGLGTDILMSGSAGINAVLQSFATFIGGSGTDTIIVESTAATGTVFDSGGGSNEALTLVTGPNTLTVTNFDFLNGSTGNDTLTLEGAASGLTIDLGAGTDIVNLANATNIIALDEVETLNGGSGTDTVTLSNTAASLTFAGIESLTAGSLGDALTAALSDVSGMTINGGGNLDTLTILGGGTLTATNLANVSNIETWVLTENAMAYNITTADGNVTAGNALTIGGVGLSSALNFDGSAETGATGAFSVIGGSGADTLTGGGDADFLSGNGGSDMLSGGAGNDTIATGAASDTVLYAGINEFGDTITDFTAGSGGDLFDFSMAIDDSLQAKLFTQIGAGDGAAGHGVFALSTDTFTNYNVASSAASDLTSLGISGFTSGYTAMFAIGNGPNTHLWYWDDGTGGTSDGVIETGELTSIAELTGVDVANITEDNFADIVI
ncbi:MAG: calcium-binding protein [Proteobacteria bacterium]|nr:calcium-binding protein [Pseudomonadota bacterium]